MIPRKLLKINAGDTLIVRRPFRMAGREYVKGDVFNWAQRAVAHRKVMQMVTTGLVEPTEPTVEARVAPEAASVAVSATKAAETPSDDGVEVDLMKLSLKHLQAMAETAGKAKKYSKKSQIEELMT